MTERDMQAGSRLVRTILKFAGVCRAGGLGVSTAETIDCIRQLQWIDIADETAFRAVLRTNFSKSRREQGRFDRLYRLFFRELGGGQPADDDTAAPEALHEAAAEKLLERALQAVDPNNPLNKSLIDFLRGAPESFLAVLRRLESREEQAASGMKSNLGQLSGRLEILLAINRLDAAIGGAAGGGFGAGSGDQGRNQTGGQSQGIQPPADPSRNRPDERLSGAAARTLANRLDTARRMLSEDTRPDNEALKRVNTHEARYGDIGEKPLSGLTPDELIRMQEIINRLVRKLRDRAGRRFFAASRGRLDVRKTLRHANRFQGIPVMLQYRRRPPRKAKIVALCDVSGSVWSTARFMLHILHSLQECFSSVTSFAFIRATTDITEIFEKHDAGAAVERVLASGAIEFGTQSDYGEVFHQFRRDHLSMLDRRTTLIIVGDGRSNYHHPREEALAEIREKSRRIIWLNPEPEDFWHTGDSEMYTYRAYCHETRVCRNLNQLVDFVEELVV